MGFADELKTARNDALREAEEAEARQIQKFEDSWNSRCLEFFEEFKEHCRSCAINSNKTTWEERFFRWTRDCYDEMCSKFDCDIDEPETKKRYCAEQRKELKKSFLTFTLAESECIKKKLTEILVKEGFKTVSVNAQEIVETKKVLSNEGKKRLFGRFVEVETPSGLYKIVVSVTW